MTLSLGAITTLVVASLAIGAAAFGAAPLTSSLDGTFESTDALTHITIITTYIAVTLLFTSGVAFLMTVVTDVPLRVVCTSVVIVIVSQILDALETLGDLRRWLPSHYARAGTDELAPTIDWTFIANGAAFSVVGFRIFIVWSVLKFDKKDVR